VEKNSIEHVVEVDPNGIALGYVEPPILKAFAMVAQQDRVWTIDQISDLTLRLSSWGIHNTTDVESCVFALPFPLFFTGDQLDQMAMAVLGDEAVYLIGRVQHRNDLILISFPRIFDAGSECQGYQVPITFYNFSSVPFPLTQGISWNARNQSIMLPVVLDWTVTKLANINPHTGEARAIPYFNLTSPDTMYAGSYEAVSNTYTVVTTSAWPVWSYKTWNFFNRTFSQQNDLDMPDAQFFIQAACVY